MRYRALIGGIQLVLLFALIAWTRYFPVGMGVCISGSVCAGLVGWFPRNGTLCRALGWAGSVLVFAGLLLMYLHR